MISRNPFVIADGTVVAAGCSMKFSHLLPTSEPHRPTWLSIPDAIAENFLVTGLQIGQNFQLNSTGCLPASLFSESECQWRDLESEGLMMDTLGVGTRLTIWVTNKTSTPQPFACDLISLSIKNVDQLDRMNLRYVLGLGYNKCEASRRLTIHVQPQVVFTPSELYLPSDVRKAFVLKSITKCLPDESEHSRVPSELVDVDIPREIRLVPYPVLSLAQFLNVDVENRSNTDQWFAGAVLGSLRPQTKE